MDEGGSKGYYRPNKLEKNSETRRCYVGCVPLNNMGIVPGLIKLIIQYVRETRKNISDSDRQISKNYSKGLRI